MIGVSSNDFERQEPGNNKEIKNFCKAKFGITFPMTEKVSVTSIAFIISILVLLKKVPNYPMAILLLLETPNYQLG